MRNGEILGASTNFPSRRGGGWGARLACLLSLCAALVIWMPGAAFAIDCPNGSQPDASGTDCEPCPPGSAGIGGVCETCKPGRYSPGGDTGCGKCSSGKSSNAGAATCYKCPPGSFAAGGDPECTPCKAGTFAANEGAAACGKCSSGLVSGTGASECNKPPNMDLTEDGKVNIMDSVMLVWCLLGEGLCKGADYNGDSETNVLDLQKSVLCCLEAASDKSCSIGCPAGQLKVASGWTCVIPD